MVKVSCVASGFKLNEEDIKASLSWWLRQGILIERIGEISFKKDLLCSSNLESRIQELKQAFSKKISSKIVWALRGGYGMQEVIPYLKPSDFKTKKTYIGFSDCTSLHYYLNKNLGLSSIHGPHVSAAFQKLNNIDINNKINILLRNPYIYSDTFKKLRLLNTSTKNKILAKLIGGNLTTLVSIIGTKIDKGSKGDILFLEEVEEPAYKINRMLTHLNQSEFLSGVKAIVFGHFSHSNKKQEQLIKKVLKRWALNQKFPVLSGLQAGHIHLKNNPLWLGKRSKLILDDEPSLINNI